MSRVEHLLSKIATNHETEKDKVYKSYVVETDVTKAQTKQKTKEDRSSW